MWGGLFCRRRQRITHRESLAGIPILNPAAKTVVEHGRTLIVLQAAPCSSKARHWPLWLVRLQPLRRGRRFALDAAGVEVLDLMDGHRSVEQIITTFGARHALPRETAEYSVTMFLRTLLQRSIAAVVVPPVPAQPTPGPQVLDTKKGSGCLGSSTLTPEP